MPERISPWEIAAQLAELKRLAEDAEARLSQLTGQGAGGSTGAAPLPAATAPPPPLAFGGPLPPRPPLVGGGPPSAAPAISAAAMQGQINSMYQQLGAVVAAGAAPVSRLAQAANAAAVGVGQFGTRTAFIARAALSGGPGGMAGGILGALAGLPIGAARFGALVGNELGQKAIGGTMGRNAADVELGLPALARAREFAERDAAAASGRLYASTYAAQTALERFKSDFSASGGQTVRGAVGNFFDRLGTAVEKTWLTTLARIEGIAVKPGAGQGLAPYPGPRIFHSADEVYLHAAVAAMDASAAYQAQREAEGRAAASAASAARMGTFPGTVGQDLRALGGRAYRVLDPQAEARAFSTPAAAFGALLAGEARPFMTLTGDLSPNRPALAEWQRTMGLNSYRTGQPVLAPPGELKAGPGPTDADFKGGPGPDGEQGAMLRTLREIAHHLHQQRQEDKMGFFDDSIRDYLGSTVIT